MEKRPKIDIPVPEFQPSDFMKEVMEDAHRFIVLRWHRRARKTTLGLNKLIRACCETENETYAYIAPTYKQAKSIVVRDPLMLNRYLPKEVLAKPFNESELYANFTTGSVLRILGADEPDSIRGPRFKGVVLDEWALQKREIFDEILEPVLRENDGWAQFQFTPKGRNHAYDFWRRGNTPDHLEWKSFDLTADQSRLFTQEQLNEMRKEMGEDLYNQEMMCQFLEDVQAVFRGIQNCTTGDLEEPVEGRRYVMGVDLGRHHDATVVIVLDVATRRLVAYKRLTETHWSLQKLAIASLAQQYDSPMVVDSTGFSAGDPISEELKDMGFSVEAFQITNQSKKMLVDGLRVAIADRLITFPNIEQLITELQDFQITMNPKTNTVYYHAPEGEGYFDDSVIALALAVYGLKGDLFVSRTTLREYTPDEVPVNAGYGF